MDTRAYLERVLPRTGYYAVLVINEQARRQKFFNNIDSLASAIKQFNEAGFNTYVAVNSFTDPANGRKQDNVAACRSFYMDVDCGPGKPYASQLEGAKALAAFIKAAKLPSPMVISSGRGLHVYWTLDTDILPSQWKPVADLLKQAAAAHGFNTDMSVTGDSARVLRPTGTANYKGDSPTPVRLLRDGPSVQLYQLSSALASSYPLNPPSPRVASALTNNIAVKAEFPPAVGHVVVSKCQQMEWITTHQAEVAEPLWYAMLGIAAHCEDAELMAVQWSNQHPGFDHARTVSKLNQWMARTTGPTLCSKMEELRPGGCKGCVFRNKISSPCSLGLQYAEKVIDEQQAQTLHPNYTLAIPKPFKRTEQGIKLTIDDTDTEVCRFDIFPVSYGYDEGLGYEVARFMWDRPNVGWSELALRNAYLADGSREFPTVIGDKGVTLMNRKLTETFQYMLRAYMDELRNQRTMTNHYQSMGWKNDNTEFLIGTRLYKHENGHAVMEDVSTSSKTKLINKAFGIEGRQDNWTNLTAVLAKGDLPAHQFALLVSLSAPFYQFTGLNGVTLSLYGPTGTGKTLAQYWQQSVWGDPVQLHYTAKFTQNALFSRMAVHNNLPFTIDEATMMGTADAGEMLYWVSQGRDKSRLDRSAVERDPRTWSLPNTVSTNRPLLGGAQNANYAIEAQQARLLEITVPDTKVFNDSSDTGRRVYNVLSTNYGHAGHSVMMALMEKGPGNIKQMIDSASSTFTVRYGMRFAGQERYWELLVVLADLAGSIANDLGLLKFDYSAAIKWALDQIRTVRRTSALARPSCFDIISDYLAVSVGTIITVMHTKGQDPIMDHTITPRGELRGRFDVYRPDTQSKYDNGTLTLDRKTFRRWLHEQGGDFRTFMEELNAAGANATPKSDKAMLGRDTVYKLGQVYVVGVSLTHPEMMNTLNSVEATVQSLTVVPMAVTQ